VVGARFLATVLVTDIVESTARAAELGDGRWLELLDRHDAMVRRRLAARGGREVKMTGDGALATFDTPVDAVTCALETRTEAVKLGLEIRAGLHTGECEGRGADIGGMAIHIATRIAEKAAPGEVLVSSTVKDLVTGSKLDFVSRGGHRLKGVTSRWELFAAGAVAARRSKATPSTTRVVLVDDHPLWRQTLRGVLEHGHTAEVVGEAADGIEAVDIARATRPDVVVMDIDMPGMDGVDATRQVLSVAPQTRVLVLSSSDHRAQVLRAVQAGASGYLLKTAGPAEITDGVRRVRAGELVFPPSLADVVLAALRSVDDPSLASRSRGPLTSLTDREREVLALMAEGRSNQAISDRIHVSAKTVEGYIGSIFSKLGLEVTADDSRRVLAVIAYLSDA
jgi:DNA-binding NarL/FixJ family response regulator/class 3 adenylate cyclase